MLTAYIASCLIPHIPYNLTKSALFKKRASFPFSEDKMSFSFIAYIRHYLLAKRSF